MPSQEHYSITQKAVYNVWLAMHHRCYKITNPQYKDYGGRGVFVSEDWHVFENFFLDMGPRPKGYTLERKNNDLHYCKENCCWADRTTQQLNRRVLESNKLKVAGVYYFPGRENYQARFMQRHLGTFKSLFEAVAARKSAEAAYARAWK